MLEENANPKTINKLGHTLLHTFLKIFCDPHNPKSFENYFKKDAFQIILRLLLDHINIHTIDNQGIKPLDLAIDNVPALALMILMKRLPANLCDENNNNILHKFAQWHLRDINSNDKEKLCGKIFLMIKSGANQNEVNSQGSTPLQTAINSNNALVVEALIAYGAAKKHYFAV